MKELAYINKYFFKYKYRLLLGIVFIIISNFFVIVPAVIVRNAINLLQRSYSIYTEFDHFQLQNKVNGVFSSSIVILTLLILSAALLRGLFLFFVRQTVIVMSRRIEYDLKHEIYEHYQQLPLSFYRKNNTGDLMARISEDVSKVRMYVGPAVMYGISLVTLFSMVIPYMFSIDAKLTLYALIPLPFLSFSIYFVSNIINKRSEEIQRSLSGLSTYVQEAFSGIRVIKSFAREKQMENDFDKESNDYKNKSLNLVKVQGLFLPLIMGLIGLSVVLTVYIGATQVFDGAISTGNIAEFLMYVYMLTWPVTSLGWITSIVQRAEASQKRINEFLKTKSEIISEKNLEKEISGHIVFDKVNFKYPDSGIHALKDVSLEVKPGDSLAIVGTTGSGKTTLANLICRMYDINGGSLSIDQHNIKDYSLSSLRGQIGYVPQDVFLFSETIRENIAFGKGNLTDEEIKQAAKDADLLENISRFKDGFETKVGERGITLSGGQKQRVSIARAIATKPKILILDDALSAVDTQTENTILNAMKRIMTNRTSIIISHRVSSAKLANHVVMLDEGRIVEQGSHDELMQLNGAYKSLHDKQLVGES